MVRSVPALGCLDDNVATEFVSGALTGPQVVRVESHLATCADCRSLVAALATTSHEDSDIHTQPRLIGHAATLPAAPSRPFQRGEQVGRYLFLDAIGAGGMGVVFSAYDPNLGRKVAIKLLRSGGPINATEARARLRREAQAIAQLNHPNVVAVYDVGTTESGDVYVAMEFVDGDTLKEWLSRWDRSWRDIIDIFVQAGRGLSAAHEEGLLHRDFKPDNVLVGANGRPRVGDFGLARSLITPEDLVAPLPSQRTMSTPMTSPLTATGTVLGTPRYMPPEQLIGAEIDARSDQFAFCVALYEALFRRHPILGETAVAMVERGVRAQPPPDGHKVPAVVVAAIMRGLEGEPARRFPSMTALLAELTRPQLRRSTTWIAAGAFGIAAATAAAVVVVTRSNAAPIVQPPSDPGLLQQVQELDLKLNVAIADRQRLREELVKAIEARDVARDGLIELEDQLQAQLEQKDQEIELLNDEVRALQKIIRKPKPQLPERAVDELHAATEIIEGDLRGCFGEWRERNPRGQIKFTVTLVITERGAGESASTSEISDVSLPLCVKGALVRARYPRGPKQRVVFDVRSGPGTSPSLRVLDARPAPPSEIIELESKPPPSGLETL
jgi:eukaryotic-like serine/threonine-protein kinase